MSYVNPYLLALAGLGYTPQQVIAGFDPSIIAGDDDDDDSVGDELSQEDLNAIAAGEIGALFGKKKKKKKSGSGGVNPLGRLAQVLQQQQQQQGGLMMLPGGGLVPGVAALNPQQLMAQAQLQHQLELQRLQMEGQRRIMEAQQNAQVQQVENLYGAANVTNDSGMAAMKGGAYSTRATGTMRERDLGIESASALAVGESAVCEAQPDGFAFQAHRLILPPTVAGLFVITSWTIGGQNQMAGSAALSCAGYTADNVAPRKYDVCPPGNKIIMRVENRYGTATGVKFTGTFVGSHARNG